MCTAEDQLELCIHEYWLLDGVCDRCLNSLCDNQDNYMEIFPEKRGTKEKYLTVLPHLIFFFIKFLVELVKTERQNKTPLLVLRMICGCCICVEQRKHQSHQFNHIHQPQ